MAASDTHGSLAVGSQLGVYQGDQIILQGYTHIVATQQARVTCPPTRDPVLAAAAQEHWSSSCPCHECPAACSLQLLKLQ